MPRNLQNSQLWIPDAVDDSGSFVNELNPLPVRLAPAESFVGAGYAADLMWKLAKEGRIFVASDADSDDVVTGTVSASFTTATSTFILDVPNGVTAIPLIVNLQQSGTVAGGTVFEYITIDNEGRYASGGTVEKVFSTLGAAPQSRLISGATVTTDAISFGARVFSTQMGQDVASAEGAIQAGVWRPEYPILLKGPAALIIYTHAATTAPQWNWNISFAEMQSDELFA